MKINLIVGVVLLGVLFSSCEKWQVAEDIPDPEELVVVNAAFSPSDSVVAVYVGNASSDFQSAFLASELAINNFFGKRTCYKQCRSICDFGRKPQAFNLFRIK
ncbi:MAG: hypothetical protein ACJAZY_002323 [Spirosomataceae bacterium]|jgi:hypothetical protein